MAESRVIVFASFIPKAGQESDLEALLRRMTEQTRREPGCEVYDLYVASEGPTSFHLFERYTNRVALEAHRTAEYYKAYRQRVPDLLAEPVKFVVLQGLDVAT